MHSHILIAVALDHEAMEPRKIELARHLLAEDGKITLVTVLEDIPGFVAEFIDMKPAVHLSQKVLQRLKDLAAGDDRIEAKVINGKAGVQIVRFANENNVDLIVVGSHKPGAQDYFMGSTAARVARRADCSVYVVR